MFLDFRKAFNTVPLSTLLDKLSNSEMNWFTLYWVNDTAQKVVVDMGIHLVDRWSLEVFSGAKFYGCFWSTF